MESYLKCSILSNGKSDYLQIINVRCCVFTFYKDRTRTGSNVIVGRVKGRALSLTSRQRNALRSAFRTGVNLKIVQWTIFKEGHALQERAAPKNELYLCLKDFS